MVFWAHPGCIWLEKNFPFFFSRSRHRWLKYPWTPKNLTTSVVTGDGRYLDTEPVFFRLERWGGFLTFFSGNVPPRTSTKIMEWVKKMVDFFGTALKENKCRCSVMDPLYYTQLPNCYVMCIYLANSLCWSFWLELDNHIYRHIFSYIYMYIWLERLFNHGWKRKFNGNPRQLFLVPTWSLLSNENQQVASQKESS